MTKFEEMLLKIAEKYPGADLGELKYLYDTLAQENHGLKESNIMLAGEVDNLVMKYGDMLKYYDDKRFAYIKGRNIDEVWFKTLTDLCRKGRFFRITSGSHAGDFRLEFDKLSGIVEKVFWLNSAGTDYLPVAPTVPDGCPAPTTEESIIKYFNHDIMASDLYVEKEVAFKDVKIGEFFRQDGNLLRKINSQEAISKPKDRKTLVCKDVNTKVWVKRKFVHYLYGTFIVGGEYRLPMSDTIMQVPDQTDWLIKHYMKHGFGNNHGCLMIGYPESNLAYDEPYDKANETDRNTSPCLRVIDTKIITDDDGVQKVNVEVLFRSWDLYAGMPENLAGLGMWQQYVAYSLGIEPGVLGFTSIKAHVYGSRIKALAMRAGDGDLEARFKQVLEQHGVNYDEIPDAKEEGC